MTKIYSLAEIKQVTKPKEVIKVIEEGFILYAKGLAVVAPLSSLEIENRGVAKIKYGYIKGSDIYVMKIASSFPGNAKHHLPTVMASMQIYDNTGQFLALLLDEAYLTNVRTAATSAVIAKHFSPKKINKIGIIGAGVQARFQLDYLRWVTPCKDIMVWARHLTAAQQFKCDMEKQYFHVEIAKKITDLTSQCNLIITVTSATEPILWADQVQPGTLIISVGSDTTDKHEIDSTLLKKANLIIADSKSQCRELGNIKHALDNKIITEDSIIALGDVLEKKGHTLHEKDIIIANLTGVAVQDIQVATLIYQKLIA